MTLETARPCCCCQAPCWHHRGRPSLWTPCQRALLTRWSRAGFPSAAHDRRTQTRPRRWAPVRAGERVRVLFLVPSFSFPGQYQFEAQALARSFDLDCDLVPLVDARRPDKQDPVAMDLLRRFLGTRRYDALPMAGAWLTALPGDCASEIIRLIRADGVGFVHSVPGVPPESAQDGLDAVPPIAADPTKPRAKSWKAVPIEAVHPLTGGSDFRGMSWVCDVDAAAAPDATVPLRSEKLAPPSGGS